MAELQTKSAPVQADIDTKDIDAVCAACDRIYRSMFSDANPDFMRWACGWFRRIFDGHYLDYQPIDVPYHDREHTMQGLLCLTRLLQGRANAGVEPPVPRSIFELGILGILLHDTGYLKHSSDTDGTGAKYTLIHVDRSTAFAASFLQEQGYTAEDIRSVQNMIQCTSLNASLSDISFSSPIERTVGFALASADLMGQMSAEDYVERLPQLYAEFKESVDYYGDRAYRLYYDSADQLVANTPEFWESYVKPKLENVCGGVYRYLNDPYPNGSNPYLECIEANVEKAARTARK